MTDSALKVVPPDYDSLLGYESALMGHCNQLAVYATPDEDTFNALDLSGVPAIFPRDGVWLKSHAELVQGWEIVFAFNTPRQRIAAASVFDGYAHQLLILTDEKTGHSDLESYLIANDNNADGLNDLAMRASPYDFREEQAKRAAIIPLESQLSPQAPYPIDALGPIMGPITQAIISNVQVSKPLAAQSVLAVASLTAQQYADVQPPYFGAKSIPCAAYFLTVAESGERKSAANNAALAPMVKWETHLSERYEHQIENYRRSKGAYDKMVTRAEGKAKTIADARQMIDDIGEEPTRPLSPAIILNEPTIEGFLKSAEHSHASRAIITDEAGAILGGHSMTPEKKQYTITTLSKLWDASSITMVRVGRETPTIRHKRLTMHLMGQSVIINPLLADPLAQGQGFLARFLTVSAPPRAGFRELKTRAAPSDYQALNAWTNHIYGLLSERPVYFQSGTDNELKPETLELDDEAFKAWATFADEIEKAQRPEGRYAEMKPFASKAAEHVLRIAGIFTVIENPRGTRNINGATLARAVELIQYYTDEHLRLIEQTSADPRLVGAARLIEWIKANRGAYFCTTDLRQSAPRGTRRSKGDLERHLETLCEHNHIQEVDPRVIDGTFRKKCFEVLA